MELAAQQGCASWPLAWEHWRIRGSQRAQEKGFFFFCIRVIVFHIFSILVSCLWVGLWFLFFFCNLFLWFLEKMRSNNNYNGKENVNIKSKNLFFNFHRRWENTRNHNILFTIVRLQLFFSFLKMLQYIILTNNIQQKCRWLLVVLIMKKNYTHLKLAPITDEHGSFSDSIHGCVAGSRLWAKRLLLVFFAGEKRSIFLLFSFLLFLIFFFYFPPVIKKSSLRYKEFDAVYALQFDWQRNYIVVKF